MLAESLPELYLFIAVGRDAAVFKFSTFPASSETQMSYKTDNEVA